MSSNITYCISPCPFKDCKRHGDKIKELTADKRRYIGVADFAPICRKYIGQIVKETIENARTRTGNLEGEDSEEA